MLKSRTLSPLSGKVAIVAFSGYVLLCFVTMSLGHPQGGAASTEDEEEKVLASFPMDRGVVRRTLGEDLTGVAAGGAAKAVGGVGQGAVNIVVGTGAKTVDLAATAVTSVGGGLIDVAHGDVKGGLTKVVVGTVGKVAETAVGEVGLVASELGGAVVGIGAAGAGSMVGAAGAVGSSAKNTAMDAAASAASSADAATGGRLSSMASTAGSAVDTGKAAAMAAAGAPGAAKEAMLGAAGSAKDAMVGAAGAAMAAPGNAASAVAGKVGEKVQGWKDWVWGKKEALKSAVHDLTGPGGETTAPKQR